MSIDQAGKHCRLAEVDDSCARGNFDLGFRPDIGDAIVHDQHNLFRQHLPVLAVKQLACANRHRSRSLRTRVEADMLRLSHTWLRADTPPWLLLARTFLGPEHGHGAEHSHRCHQQNLGSHNETSARIVNSMLAEATAVWNTMSRSRIHWYWVSF